MARADLLRVTRGLFRGDDEDVPMSTFEEELALLESEESEFITSADALQSVSKSCYDHSPYQLSSRKT